MNLTEYQSVPRALDVRPASEDDALGLASGGTRWNSPPQVLAHRVQTSPPLPPVAPLPVETAPRVLFRVRLF